MSMVNRSRPATFGLATALAYVAIGQALVSPAMRPTNPIGLWEEVVTRLFSDPFSLLLVATTVLGTVLFTDTRSRSYPSKSRCTFKPIRPSKWCNPEIKGVG
jgi:hypothetical protein